MSKKRDAIFFSYQKKFSEVCDLRHQLKLEKPNSNLSRIYALEAAIESKTKEYEEAKKKYEEIDKEEHEKKEKEDEKNASASPNSPVFIPYTLNDLLNMPPKEWMVDQVFGKGDIGMFYGPSGCGKTFVIIDFIIKMCIGSPWAGRFRIYKALNVAYCAGEGNGALPQRFAAAVKYNGITGIHNFTYYNTVPQIFCDDSGPDTIIQFIKEYNARQQAKESPPLDVLVIDTLHTATIGAEENSSKDMGKILQSCKTAIKKLGCTVILVHHTNKTGEEERGSSSLRGAMDFMIRLKKKEEHGTLATMHCSKLKDGEQWKDQDFNLSAIENCSSVYVRWDSPSDVNYERSTEGAKEALISEMRKRPGVRFTCKSLSEAIAKQPNYTNKILERIANDKICQRDLLDPEKKSSNSNPWVYFV